MKGKTATALVLVIVIAALSALAIWFQRHGFSAREEPTWYEKTLARHARRIATPAGAKELKNPYPLTLPVGGAARLLTGAAAARLPTGPARSPRNTAARQQTRTAVRFRRLLMTIPPLVLTGGLSFAFRGPVACCRPDRPEGGVAGTLAGAGEQGTGRT